VLAVGEIDRKTPIAQPDLGDVVLERRAHRLLGSIRREHGEREIDVVDRKGAWRKAKKARFRFMAPPGPEHAARRAVDDAKAPSFRPRTSREPGSVQNAVAVGIDQASRRVPLV
jgi:hypothetical protein